MTPLVTSDERTPAEPLAKIAELLAHGLNRLTRSDLDELSRPSLTPDVAIDVPRPSRRAKSANTMRISPRRP